MAPPRKHETDVILDAARALVLAGGPRAASVAAIANASGAPAGTLYHRFGNRDGIVAAAWLRALERFQARALAAAEANGGGVRGRGMAVAAVSFARELPDDARLLLMIRPGDLLDGEPDAAFRETLDAMNAPLTERVGTAWPENCMGAAIGDPSTPWRERSRTCPMPSSVGMRMTRRCRRGWKPMSQHRRGRYY